MKPPKQPAAPDMEPPSCLTDGSNDQIPRDYISKWKVNEGNKEQRMKELVYTINMLKSKGMSELVLNSKTYDRDFYLLGKGVFKANNSKNVNRQLVIKTLLDNGLAELCHMYWDAIVVEFEVKRREEDNSLSTGQLWKVYTDSQKHLTSALANCYNAMIVFWNGSDFPNEESLKMIYEGTIRFILSALDNYLHPSEVDTSHPQHKLIKSFLGTIHNCCHKYDVCIPDLRLRDTLRIVAKYRSTGTSTLKTKSILICAYLLTENDDSDRSLIELDQGDIAFMIKVLEDAIHNTDEISKKYGYHAEEIICGLDHIAFVESNKRRLVQAGVLPLYVEALLKKNPDLQESAAKALWTLAFDDENLSKVKSENGCMTELRNLSESKIPHVKAAADGALWKLEGETAHLQKLSTKPVDEQKQSKKNLPHIMVSYQWDSKATVLRLRQRLKEEGYRVWLDVEQMSGNTLKSMAAAVEHAVVFVPVLTEKYKASPACRQEAEYGHHLKKKMVPVRAEPKYRPDGWLGFMLGSTYFYDLSKETDFEQKVVDFVKAVGDSAKILPGEDENPVYDVSDDEVDNPLMTATSAAPGTQLVPSHLINPLMSSTSVVEFDISALVCFSWSCKQVSDWLTKHKLGKYVESLEEVDGELLAELLSMRFVSPDTYYDILREEYNMMALDLLRFNSAIRKLALN